jgi:hypothetical protein
MFVSDETQVRASFAAVSARLANLAQGAALLEASRQAYDQAAAGLMCGVGPATGVSRLVGAQFRGLVTRGVSAVLTLRWEAAGAAGGLFPALDADITISPAGAGMTLLRIDGAYRAPLGAIGAGLDSLVLHRVASATIRAFIGRVADLIAHPAPQAGQQRRSPEPGYRVTTPAVLASDASAAESSSANCPLSWSTWPTSTRSWG